MEPSKQSFSFYIFTRMKLGDSSSSFDTAACWIRQFSDDREPLEDELERSGWAHSSLTRDILAHAEAIVTEDGSITLRLLVSELDISYGSAYSLLHTELKQSKKYARWVPHTQLTRPGFTGYSAWKGYLQVTAKYYMETVLLQVLQKRAEAARSRSGSRLLLHHDNASSQSNSKNDILGEGIQVLPHSPDSPDLAPCDFWLFQKWNMGSLEDLFQTFRTWQELCVHNIPASEYAGCS